MLGLHVHLLNRPDIFAALGVACALLRYGTYIHSIFRGKTRPHVFSWANWTIMVGIGAYAQYRLGGGPSAVALTVVSASCFFITILALFRGEKNITPTDWIAFIGSLLAIPVWRATHDPLWALIILVFIDVFAYYPTIRKTWLDPWSEAAGSLFISGLRYFFILLAVPVFTGANVMYPVALMLGDWGLMGFVISRRRKSTAD